MKQKKNRVKIKFVFGSMFCFALFLGAVILQSKAALAQEVSQKAEIEKNIAGQLTGKNVVKKLCYEDYDKDGRPEAFVLSGPKKAGKLKDANYTLWFAYIQDGAVVSKKIRKDITVYSKMLKLKSATLFCAATYCTTSSPMDVYQVAGNDIKVIFHGDMISETEGDSFVSIHSTYDLIYDAAVKQKMGHTWKPYYFYYKNGKVYEYKGKKISLKTFKKYKNAEKMLKKYKKLGKIKSILYRSNGMVHVNYKTKYQNGDISYCNVTFQTSGNKLIKPVCTEGTYRKKLK